MTEGELEHLGSTGRATSCRLDRSVFCGFNVRVAGAKARVVTNPLSVEINNVLTALWNGSAGQLVSASEQRNGNRLTVEVWNRIEFEPVLTKHVSPWGSIYKSQHNAV